MSADPTDDHDVLDRRGAGQGDVDRGLERVGLALPESAVCGDEDLALGVVDAIDERVGREPAEHHRVRRTEPGTRQHGDGKLGDHRHVHRDPVALHHAQPLEGVGEPLHLGVEVGVGHDPLVTRLAFPVVGDLVAPARLDVAVEAVVGDVELGADEPLGEGQIPLEDRVPLLVPRDQLGRLLGPEALEVLVGLVVQRGVDDQSVLLERFRRRKCAVLDEVVLDRGPGHRGVVSHSVPPSCGR